MSNGSNVAFGRLRSEHAPMHSIHVVRRSADPRPASVPVRLATQTTGQLGEHHGGGESSTRRVRALATSSVRSAGHPRLLELTTMRHDLAEDS
jgi:hypothetical protein